MTARDRIIIAVVLMAAALGGFWFVGLAPKRHEAAALQAQVDAASQKLAGAQQMAAQARSAKASYDKDYADVAKLGKAVPKSDALPSLLYQLQSAAHNARIDFRSLKVNGSSGAPTAATPAANTAAAANGNPGGSTAPNAAAPSASATATQAAAATLPPGASVGSAGFPTMPFSFVFTGSFFDMETFLHDVQRFVHVRGKGVDVTGRLLSIDAFSLTAGPGGFPSVNATISATAYVLAPGDGPSATSGAAGTPSTPGTSATPAPTTSAPAATASEVAR
jgi:Tfp pilus assembly protein PilO